MDRFIRILNVARYRRLLERVTEEPDRETIIKPLAAEQHKQKVAGDPVTPDGGKLRQAAGTAA